MSRAGERPGGLARAARSRDIPGLADRLAALLTTDVIPEETGTKMRRPFLALTGTALALGSAGAGCNPYVAAASAVYQTYNAATDQRTVGAQVSDDEIEAKIGAALVASPISGTSSIKVYSRNGVVVLTGVVPYGSSAGVAAVNIARATPGVTRVETFFVRSEPSETSDLEIEAAIKKAFVEDSNLESSQVSAVVYGGHVALIGEVASYQTEQEFIEDAQGVSGVVSVRSYIQVSGP